MSCAACNELIDINTLKCSGQCGEHFHISCLSKNNPQYKNTLATSYMSKITNLRWFCDVCIQLPQFSFHQIHVELTKRITDIKSYADSVLTLLNTSTMHSDFGNTPPQIQSGNAEIDSDLNGSSVSMASVNAVDESTIVSPSIESLNASETQSSVSSINVTDRKGKRLLETSHDSDRQAKLLKVQQQQQTQRVPDTIASLVAQQMAQHPQKRSQHTQLRTLADIVNGPSTSMAPAPDVMVHTNMMRSLYISPFPPMVQASHIIDHLNSKEDLKHLVAKVKCTKLGTYKRPASYVSFRLDVERHHYEMFANEELWNFGGPTKITATPFIVKPKRRSNPNPNPFAPSQRTQNHGHQSMPDAMANNAGSNPRGQRSQTNQGPPNQNQNNWRKNQQQSNFRNHSQPQSFEMRSELFDLLDRFIESRCDRRPYHRR